MTDLLMGVPGGGGTGGGIDVSITGNTSGATSLVSTGTLTLAGGANITLSQNGQAISIIGGAGAAAGTNTISASGTSIAGTALSLALAAGANVSLQTATGVGSMTVSVSGLNALSASGFASSTGTMVLSAGANVALSTGASTITISASVQTYTHSLSMVGNTTNSASGTFSGVLSISGAGIVSVGASNNNITISATTPSVTNYSTISLSGVGNTTNSASGTVNNVLSISGAGIVSVGISNNNVTISATTPSVTNYSTVSLSAVGNTTNSASGTYNNVVSISGAGIISAGVSNNNITISATTPSVVSAFGISSSTAGGVTQGTTTVAQGTILLVAGSNVTLSSSAGAITVIGPAPGAAAISVSATSVAGGSISGGGNSQFTTLNLVAGQNIGISQNGQSLTFSAAPGTISLTQNMDLPQIGNTVASASGTVTGTAGFGSSLFLNRIFIPGVINLSEVDLAMGLNFNATNNGAGTLSQSFVLYSFGNSSSLGSVLSASATFAWQTGTSTSGAVVSLTQFQGGWSVNKIHPMTFASTSVSPGQYVVGNLLNFAQATSTWTASLFGAAQFITNSTTFNPVTTTGQTTMAALSSAASLAITNKEGTTTHNSASGATITTNSSHAISAVGRTVLTGTPTTGTAISSLSLSTQSIVPQYLTVPNFVYIGTNSTTSALPSVFIAGIMSTGAIPVAITVTSSAVTYSGTPAGAQPYFALVGA